MSEFIPRWLQAPHWHLQDWLESLEVGNLCLVRIPKIEVTTVKKDHFGCVRSELAIIKPAKFWFVPPRKFWKISLAYCNRGDAGKKKETMCYGIISFTNVHDTLKPVDTTTSPCATIWVHAPRPFLHLGDFLMLCQRHLFWNCSKSVWRWWHANHAMHRVV